MKDEIITLKKETYTVIDSLKSGGQGNIWRVRRHSDDKVLAMKSVLLFRLKNNHKEYLTQTHITNNQERLQGEINFLTSLTNPKESFIVPCLDTGFIEDKEYGAMPIWVMPLYGQTLEDKMLPYPKNSMPPLVSDCLKWMSQIALALKTTHAYRKSETVMIHRDVKAANIMLADNGDARLIDFGIVHETLVDENTGTHSYSTESGAPEQILPIQNIAGKNRYALGAHSDLYALGTVIFRLFTGAQTDAQLRLNSKDTLGEHFKILDDDNTGLLGEIGGLTDKEYKLLYNEIQFRLNDEQMEEDDGRTLISSSNNRNALPNPPFIAESIADFVRQLLNPDHQNRPSADNTIEWCNTLQRALAPKLTQLKLILDPQDIEPNKPLRITLVATGEGLPIQSEWLNLSQNGKPLHGVLDTFTKVPQHYGFISTNEARWSALIPFHEKDEVLSLSAEASLNDKEVLDTLDINIAEALRKKDSGGLKLVGILGFTVLLIGGGVYAYQSLSPSKPSPTPATGTTQAQLPIPSDNTSPAETIDPSIPLYPLTIKTDPPADRIRILNIRPVYREGIQLEKGQYRIEARKRGYHTLHHTIYLTDKQAVFNYTLHPIYPERSNNQTSPIETNEQKNRDAQLSAEAERKAREEKGQRESVIREKAFTERQIDEAKAQREKALAEKKQAEIDAEKKGLEAKAKALKEKAYNDKTQAEKRKAAAEEQALRERNAKIRADALKRWHAQQAKRKEEEILRQKARQREAARIRAERENANKNSTPKINNPPNNAPIIENSQEGYEHQHTDPLDDGYISGEESESPYLEGYDIDQEGDFDDW